MDHSVIEETLKAHLPNINIPQPLDKVYKDECVYSFDTPVNYDFHGILFITTITGTKFMLHILSVMRKVSLCHCHIEIY